MAYKITEDCIGCGACKKMCPVFAIKGEAKLLHEINPKRCIECGVCGRVCPKEAVVDSSGVKRNKVPRSQWPKPVIDETLCSACAICVDACTPGALRIAPPKFKGDIHVAAMLDDPKKCIACELCRRRCPLHAITMVKPSMEEAKEEAV